ncbi:optic atrophy 3 protein-domain-containing protein [Halteromyces radiatus]|uniref:optic atrophy 3 protein-domain-containing protein n=1 Tax=Halteromyces radiatus TaxID=101107 RepID=UPI00221E558D|nr:optic atrophy 3 protein-domain-containing protein [Halteromyces radiatus]KAI8084620.1 optic atrophy 3 protein-domain-containing protein [Halteromyces radiatus]
MSTLKLGSLLIKTLAKPVANSIKTQAKQHPTFKEFCIGVAQKSHRLEMTLKMNFLGYKKEVIRPLNDARAIESGANFISEAFVFGVAASIIIAENWRSRNKDKNRRNYVDDALESLESRNNELVEKMEYNIKTLQLASERLQQLEEENVHLRNMLDEILSVSMGLKRHTQYEQPAVMGLPGITKD